MSASFRGISSDRRLRPISDSIQRPELDNQMGAVSPVTRKVNHCPRTDSAASGVLVPEEFRCPISGEVMADPVIVASGQSYERSCIQAWLEQGHKECFKSKTPLEHQFLIPNVALKTAIQGWSQMFGVCKPQPIPHSRARELVQALKKSAEHGRVSLVRYVHSASGAELRSDLEVSSSGRVPHALDTSPSSAQKCDQEESAAPLDPRVVQALVKKLKKNDPSEQSFAAAQVRSLARECALNRRTLADVELLEALVALLQSPIPEILVNSVAAILNLSLEPENKLKIVRAGAMPHLVQALKASHVEVQEHAAGAIFSLALYEENRLAIGVLGAIPPLIEILKSSKQAPGAQQDASMALYYLSLTQLNRSKMVKAGLVPILIYMAENNKCRDLASRGMCILSCLAASSEGRTALLEINGVTRLLTLLAKKSTAAPGGTGNNDRSSDGDHSSREAELKEHAVATLLQLSHHNIRFKHLAMQAGAVEILVTLLESATARAREKVLTLLSILKDLPSAGNSPSASSSSIEPFFPRSYVRRRSDYELDLNKAESSHF